MLLFSSMIRTVTGLPPRGVTVICRPRAAKVASGSTAVNENRAVLPLSLSYHNAHGEHCAAAAFVGDMSLVQSLRRIASVPRIVVSVTILPAQIARTAPSQAPHGFARRELAARCREMILEQLRWKQQPAAVPEVASRSVSRDLGVPGRLGAVQDLL